MQIQGYKKVPGIFNVSLENNRVGRLYRAKSGLADLEDFKNLKEKPCESQVNKNVPWISFLQYFGEDLSKQLIWKNGMLRVYKNIVKTRQFIGGKRNRMLIWDQRGNLYKLRGSGDYTR